MRNPLSMLIAGGLAVALVTGLVVAETARADELPQGQPFQELEDRVAALEAELAALEAELAALEVPVSCDTNTDCASDEFCHKPLGVCGTTGTCELRPAGCSAIFSPVCGCDFTTFVNPCFAAQAGSSLVAIGPCP